jgi:hypothetical protein
MSGEFAMKPRIRYVLLALLGSAAFFQPIVFAQEAKEGKKGEHITFKDGTAIVESALKTDDEKDPAQKYQRKVFTVDFKSGKNYKIDMISKEVDSYLRLEDATGGVLAKDDDSGGFVNAHINFSCRMDGAYHVICTTFAGGTGAFTLKIQEISIPDATKLNLQDGMAKVDDKLTSADATDAVQTHSAAKTYSIKLSKGKTYLIDMISKEVDPFLRLEDSTGKELAKDDDGGGGRNARIQFECPEDGEYRIFATTYFGGIGGFALTVKEK